MNFLCNINHAIEYALKPGTGILNNIQNISSALQISIIVAVFIPVKFLVQPRLRKLLTNVAQNKSATANQFGRCSKNTFINSNLISGYNQPC